MGNATRPQVIPFSWAESAVGPADISEPSDLVKAQGWQPSAIPPFRWYFNWLLNFASNGVRYLSRAGIAAWSATEAYQQFDTARVNGTLYMATGAPTVGLAPGSDLANWLQLLPAPGTLLRETFITGATTNPLPVVAGCKLAIIDGWGGGGAGGGTPFLPVGGTYVVAGGGAAGAFGRAKTTTIPASWAFTIGSGGVGVAGAGGGAGSNSTFTDGATTWTFRGGPGAVLAMSIPAGNGGYAPGGDPPAISSSSGGGLLIPGSGQPGGDGFLCQPSAGSVVGFSGAGGASVHGGAGKSQGIGNFTTANAAGADALACASAGSGAIAVANGFATVATQRGGHGFAGGFYLREYS